MTTDSVQDWLERYVRAWQTYDPDAIGDLFSDDAEYRYAPWGLPVRGRDAIVGSWLAPDGDASERDQAGSYAASYVPWLVDGNRAVAVGTSEYFTGPGGPVARRYHNVFLLEFDAEGRCRSFVEWYALER
jgi:ketosteroid isomerase-like protein